MFFRRWIIAASIALTAGPARGEQRYLYWAFDKGPIDGQPAGFEFVETGNAAAGDWRILDDDGNRVLAQLDRHRHGRRYTMAIARMSSMNDLKLSVQMKAVAGVRDQAGGLVWHYRNPENYLVARLDVLERNVRLYRFVEGNRVQFGLAENLDVVVGEWYMLRVEHRGDEVKVYLGEDVLLMEEDRHFQEAGKIGVWAKADSVMYFDELRAKAIRPGADPPN